MEIQNFLYKVIRKYVGLTLLEATEEICTSSALSQFEKGKINLVDKIKKALRERYGITITPHEDDLEILKDRVNELRISIESFNYKASIEKSKLIYQREKFMYYDVQLIIEGFNVLCTYELLVKANYSSVKKRLEFLSSLLNLMNRSQLQKYYFNLAILEFITTKDYDNIKMYFKISLDYMHNINNSFITYWYGYVLKFFSKKILSLKYLLDVDNAFKYESNVIGKEYSTIALTELFISVNEMEEAKKYLSSFIKTRKITGKLSKEMETLFFYLEGEIEFSLGNYKSALRSFKSSKSTIQTFFSNVNLTDRIYHALLKTYKKLRNEDGYKEMEKLILASDENKYPKVSIAYLLKENGDMEKYSQYIRKTVLQNVNLISGYDYDLIINDYKEYLLENKKYSQLNKLNFKKKF
ncbi:hypothetical protein RJG79_05670 [Mycoplasmatota bacterium WC44]